MATLVLAAVIRRNGHYLICRRPPGKRHAGLWEFPGGKLEPGEGMEAAARRELKEELGLEATSIGRELFRSQDPGSDFVICFTEVAVSGEPRCLHHSELRWARPPWAQEIAFAPADAKCAEAIGTSWC